MLPATLLPARSGDAPWQGVLSEHFTAVVCESFYSASQLVLGYAAPCLLIMRWEWRDRAAHLARPEVSQFVGACDRWIAQ